MNYMKLMKKLINENNELELEKLMVHFLVGKYEATTREKFEYYCKMIHLCDFGLTTIKGRIK